MTGNEPARKLDWRTALPAASLAGGILLILLSVFWPSGAVSHANWSPEQAKRYQEAAVKLHSLSMAAVHRSGDVDQQAMRNELQQAEADYNVVRLQLESAIDRPKRVSQLLRWTGIGLMAAGGLGLYFVRTPAAA